MKCMTNIYVQRFQNYLTVMCNHSLICYYTWYVTTCDHSIYILYPFVSFELLYCICHTEILLGLDSCHQRLLMKGEALILEMMLFCLVWTKYKSFFLLSIHKQCTMHYTYNSELLIECMPYTKITNKQQHAGRLLVAHPRHWYRYLQCLNLQLEPPGAS